ncbi:MAG: ATP-binding protein [Gammaproteobacteria bacterium]
MSIFRPKSMQRLILVGFTMVTIPLIAALVHATVSVDRLVRQGQRALFETVRATQGTQQLADAITGMERGARQYIVVGDESLFDVYRDKRAGYLATTDKLSGLALVELQRERLKRLLDEESRVNDIVARHEYNSPETAEAVVRYSELSTVAREMLLDNQQLLEDKVAELETNGNRSQTTLYLLTVALVPLSLISAIVFAFVTARAVRRLDKAIRLLGGGDFSRPIMITGPQDLEQLGERLNWMRLRMLEANQEKTRFLQHMSHELKTPLTAVREAAELLGEEIVGSLNGQQREIAAILRSNSVQLQKLIEDLLDFNTASSRAADLHIETVNLKKLIKNILEDYKIAALARQLRVAVDLQDIEIQGDSDKLRTMMDNLLSNAVKFSPDRGVLKISLNKGISEAIIKVEDSGPGIPESERDKVFDAFYQCDERPIAHVSGTGLGLSIAREYTQAHGGRIDVITPRDGRGACLRIVLPYIQEGSSATV